MTNLISTLSGNYSDYPEINTHIVYVLVNPDLMHVYYGCTSSGIDNRFEGHMVELEAGVHHNKLLQDLYDAGFKSWSIHQLAAGTKEAMRALERQLYTEDHYCTNTGDKPRKQSARVTAEEIQLAIRLHKQGYMYRQIAAQLNRSRDTVSHMIRGSYNNLLETVKV